MQVTGTAEPGATIRILVGGRGCRCRSTGGATGPLALLALLAFAPRRRTVR